MHKLNIGVTMKLHVSVAHPLPDTRRGERVGVTAKTSGFIDQHM